MQTYLRAMVETFNYLQKLFQEINAKRFQVNAEINIPAFDFCCLIEKTALQRVLINTFSLSFLLLIVFP